MSITHYHGTFTRIDVSFTWHHGRVVKAVDSKSTGLRPQEFESPWCRFVVCNIHESQLSLVAEHLLRKQEVGSSILPVGSFWSVSRVSYTLIPLLIALVYAPVAQWIGHPPPKREIPGSSPGGSVLLQKLSHINRTYQSLRIKQRELL